MRRSPADNKASSAKHPTSMHELVYVEGVPRLIGGSFVAGTEFVDGSGAMSLRPYPVPKRFQVNFVHRTISYVQSTVPVTVQDRTATTARECLT